VSKAKKDWAYLNYFDVKMNAWVKSIRPRGYGNIWGLHSEQIWRKRTLRKTLDVVMI